MHTRLIEKLIEENVIFSNKVIKVLLAVDRGYFSSLNPYEDSPKSIGYNATISAPHMHGYVLEYLKDHLVQGCSALDIGSGSGYLTLCMAEMMDYQGKVIGIDHIPELVGQSIRNINLCKPGTFQSRVIEIIEADGRTGYQKYAPYKAIHVGAASENVPKALIDQLADGGRMVIPIGAQRRSQKILIIDKSLQGQITSQEALSVSYIPLTDKSRQCPK